MEGISDRKGKKPDSKYIIETGRQEKEIHHVIKKSETPGI